jgi:uncharacterized membrane protein YtjA (UPF0391 family)
VVSIIAAVFGFGGVAAASAGIARILFFLFFDSVCGLVAGWPHPKSEIERTHREAGRAFATSLRFSHMQKTFRFDEPV